MLEQPRFATTAPSTTSPPAPRTRRSRTAGWVLVIAVMACGLAPGATLADLSTRTGASAVEGEVLVKFDEAVSPAQARRRLQRLGALEIEARYTPGLYRVVLGGAVNALRGGLQAPTLEARTNAFLDRVVAMPGVRGAERNYRGSGGFTPDDPLVDRQWHLDSRHGVDVKKAWSLTRGSSEITVALLDSGLLLDHPEFEGRIAWNAAEYPPNGVDDDGNGLIDDYQGWDFVENDPVPQDENGHGTHVASVMAANAGNGFGGAGIDHASRLLVLRVLDSENRGTTADVIDALTYVSRRPDVDLVNLSLVRFPRSALLGEAIERAARGATLIACAGNDGPATADDMFPGAHPDTISVGATNLSDGLAYFSSTGATLSLVAPGQDIEVVSTVRPYRSDSEDSVSGCSFAVPMVTGISSLLLSYDRSLDRIDLETYLAGSAEDLGPSGWDPAFGWGRVNAQGALKLMLLDRKIGSGLPRGSR